MFFPYSMKIVPENEVVMMEKVYVQKAEPTVLNQYNDIKITIDDAQATKGGVFGGDHIRFTIKTEPLGWVVTRKHSEFARLKIVLDKLHPGLAIPNLLKKNEKEKFGDDSNRKRIYVYERFLQDCVQNEDIKATKYFVEFLSISDRAKFVPIKKAVEKVQKVTRLEDLTTIGGEIPIDVRPQVANDAILGEVYFLQAEQIYRDIKNFGKKLAGELSQASATIEEISHRYAALDTIASNFNKKASVGKDKLEDVFGEFSKLIKTWGDSFKTQSNAIKKNLVCFYKYAIYESDSFKAMSQARFRLQTEYEKLYVELTTKKEKLFAQGDPSKWGADPAKLRVIPKEQLFADKALVFDLMLPKETATLKQYKQSYGFMNYATSQQLGKIFDSHLSTFISNSSDFIQTQIETLSKMNRDWVGFLTDIKPSEIELQAN